MMTTTPTVEQALRWLAAHPDLVAPLLTIVFGGSVTHAVQTYRRTGRIPLQDLPWKALRRIWYGLRRVYFSFPKPDDADLWPVNADIDAFAEHVGRQSYELDWPASWHYRDEDVNARRYYLAPDREYPHRQIHIRAWADGDRVLVNAHEEPSAWKHTRAHMQSTDLTGCSRWVAMNYENPNGLDPRSFEKQHDREARRADPSATGGRPEEYVNP